MLGLADRKYLLVVLLHVFLGAGVFYAPFLAKLYGFIIVLYGIYYVVKTENKNDEVLLVASYLVGSEILLRMTQSAPVYEIGKYGTMVFILVGIYYKGISKGAIPYWIFLLLLVPGILMASLSTNMHKELRKTISFNASGPVCLALTSLYTFNRRITFERFGNVLLAVGLPIISMTVYLALYTPNIRDVITGTGSSTEASGGFGPNQVSTILGLGIFVFVSRMIFNSKNKIILLVNLIIVFNIGFRGLMTFSRGGMITGVVMIMILIFITYFEVNSKSRGKIQVLSAFIVMASIAVWSYSSLQTSGLIDKRYANQDASGKEKESQLTGRENIFTDQLNDFLENPVFGVGVGMNTENRENKTGLALLSHNEIGRMLAEHGTLGIIGLLILFFTPAILYLDNKQNFYIFCFLIFWLLTINHAAMRLAAPAYIYTLSLLKIVLTDETPTVHRE